MEIKKMSIENFKGIKSFNAISFDKSSELVANNGSGKSSIMHAYFWVLGLNNDKIYPRIDKVESNKATKVSIQIEHGGEIINLERKSKPLFENSRKVGNENVYFIDGVEVLKKDYDKFVDLKFPFKALLKYNLVEDMLWKDLRLLIMTTIGLQDKSNFTDEELNTLVSKHGLTGAVTDLKKKLKAVESQIDRTALKEEIVDEMTKGISNKTVMSFVETFKNDCKRDKLGFVKDFENLSKKIALCESAVLDNEKRLEMDLQNMLGGGLEVVLRAEKLNGNLDPTCSIMKNGIDFTQLSYSQRTMSQIYLWLELCKRCGVDYPLWVDNYESIDTITRSAINTLTADKQKITLAVGNRKLANLIKVTKGDLT